MNKTTWKTLYRRLRSDKYGSSAEIYHGFTVVWSVHYITAGRDTGLHIRPAIIRDRSLTSRIDSALYWARLYRLEAAKHLRNGSYFARSAAHSIEAAKASIEEARFIRSTASAFQALA